MKIKNMLYAAMFAAIVAVLGLMPPIPLPFIPVPITLQTMGVMLAGSFLGKRLGFIKQCKNTRDSSTRRVLVMRHVLVGYELHEDFSKHIGKLVCRHRVKLCNEETELLGTLKASITTTQ